MTFAVRTYVIIKDEGIERVQDEHLCGVIVGAQL